MIVSGSSHGMRAVWITGISCRRRARRMPVSRRRGVVAVYPADDSPD